MRFRTLIAIAIVAGTAIGMWSKYRPRPVPVVVYEAKRGAVSRTISNTRAGSVKACRRAKLALPQGGQIISRYVEKGDRVKRGAPLIELWNANAAASLRIAERQLQTARLRAQDVCGRAKQADRDARRAAEMHRNALIADEQYDRAKSESESLAAQCSAAAAEVSQGSAAIELQKAELERTVLKAPFAGRIADITGEVGEFTTPSPPGIPMPAAVDLIDDSCFYVAAPVDEVDASSVRVGNPALVSIDALPRQKFAARVRRIAPYVLELEKQARTVEVEVNFTVPPAEELIVGYSADIEISPESHPDVVRIPSQLISSDNSVLIFNRNTQKLESRAIKPGLSNWQYTEVESGIEPGDLIVHSLERPGVQSGVRAALERIEGEAAAQ